MMKTIQMTGPKMMTSSPLTLSHVLCSHVGMHSSKFSVVTQKMTNAYFTRHGAHMNVCKKIYCREGVLKGNWINLHFTLIYSVCKFWLSDYYGGCVA